MHGIVHGDALGRAVYCHATPTGDQPTTPRRITNNTEQTPTGTRQRTPTGIQRRTPVVHCLLFGTSGRSWSFWPNCAKPWVIGHATDQTDAAVHRWDTVHCCTLLTILAKLCQTVPNYRINHPWTSDSHAALHCWTLLYIGVLWP